MRTFGNLFIGINSSIRKYEERTAINIESQPLQQYEQRIENILWGMGPFATQYISFSEKIYLILSAGINLEQGNGEFISDALDLTNGLNQNISKRSVRDIHVTTGFDLGIGYLITQSIGVNLSIQTISYQRQSIRTGPQRFEEIAPPSLSLFIDSSSNQVTNFMSRPIFHVGLFFALGTWRY
ncbi:hypothetical protein [Mongoliitalea lutea]|uniref:Outer membrane protein beta-barrel domain-containing protein n=1 Tax=Mongoliitalea lutea TaxID=849756 RepID=A0A8J3CUR2_9BACT|nr:hypothetical protein [Mongoliitalea lutea]GHB24032.1 hypothetical protein GCM10008106_00860 [Mongoliitalea lutea]